MIYLLLEPVATRWIESMIFFFLLETGGCSKMVKSVSILVTTFFKNKSKQKNVSTASYKMSCVVGNKTILSCLRTRKKLLKVQSAPCFLYVKRV